jgi:hypothetical protein
MTTARQPFSALDFRSLQSANGVLIPLEPCVQVGGSKPPEFADVGATNLTASRQLLQRFVVDLQQVSSLLAIEKRLEFCHGEPTTGFGSGGNCGEGVRHASLLFSDNPQDFHRSPRLIWANLITVEHQWGSIGSVSGRLGAKKNGGLHALLQED